jgi:hypothetical protein
MLVTIVLPRWETYKEIYKETCKETYKETYKKTSKRAYKERIRAFKSCPWG